MDDQIKQNNLIYLLNKAEKTACLVGKNTGENDDTLEIPFSVVYQSQEYIITVIGEKAFDSSSIKTIIFSPNSQLQIIGPNAFSNSQIESVKIPSSVISIGEEAFSDCQNLQNVEISNDSKLQIIERSAFCATAIQNIFIPSHVKEIKHYAFLLCKKLAQIEFGPNSELQVIENGAFYGTLIENLDIQSAEITLEDGWCQNTQELVKVTFNENCKNYKCIENGIIIGKSDTKSDNFDVLIFISRDIKECQIPSFIKIISPHAFSYSQITSIIIPEDSMIQKIGNSAFMHSLIEKIFIPKHVIEIGEEAFSDCHKLISVEFASDSELEIIKPNAFYECGFDEISIPSNFKVIQSNAFDNCYNLLKINIAKDSKLQIIEADAFLNSPIESLFISSNVVLEDEWCSFTPNLIKISVDPRNKLYVNCPYYDGPLVLGKSDMKSLIYDVVVFACRNIISLQIPNIIKKIASYAFTDSILEYVFIAPRIQIIGDSAFADCDYLNFVEIPQNSNLKIIKDDAFAGSSICSFYVPPKVEKISKNAFTDCENLQIIEFDENPSIQTILDTEIIKHFDKDIVIMIPAGMYK